MKKVLLVWLAVLAFLTACSYNDTEGVYSGGLNVKQTESNSLLENTLDVEEDIEEKKRNKILDAGEKLILDKYGNLYTDIRERAIVAGNGEWVIVCIAFDCTNAAYGGPMEVFVAFRVNHFIYDVDGKLLVNITYRGRPLPVSAINAAGYRYYPCKHFDTLRAAAHAGGWGSLTEDDVKHNEIAIITGDNIVYKEEVKTDLPYGSSESNSENGTCLADFKNGIWRDLWSQWCNLKMDVIDNETVQIEINWSSGAAYNTVWHITGKWDANTGRLNYENGIMLDVEYVEGQQDAIILRDYADGTGYFYFKDGYLYWVDHKENAGADCYFEPPVE